jgi:hypothetical protein
MGLMFNDGWVKIVCDLELNFFGHYYVTFGVQSGFIEL